MQKDWMSLGLMSGTSGDGVDASVIKSNGIDQYESIKDKYFEYDSDIYKDIHSIKEKIHSIAHLTKFKKELVWPMLAWPFHIVLDFPFHTKEFFPVKIFWPLSDMHFEGISWSSPELIIPNCAGIILLYIYRCKNLSKSKN